MNAPVRATEQVQLSDLKPHPRNYRVHPEDQLEHIRESIRTNGFYRNIVIAADNTILAGHGVVEACESMDEINSVPAYRTDLAPDDPRALKILTGDNGISQLAADDDGMLAGLLTELQEDGALLGTGYDNAMLADLISGVEAANQQPYSRKIEAPIYEPRNKPPPVADLVDTSKTDELVAEIDAAALPKKVKRFLELAAERHTVFDFEGIADYYAAADKPVQELMERSALVIIDFDQAVELGFVKLSGDLAAIYGKEHGTDATS